MALRWIALYVGLSFSLPALGYDITPPDLKKDGTCARYKKSPLKCSKTEEGKSKKEDGLNSAKVTLCKDGIWYYDRKESWAVNDAGPDYVDRCKYIDQL